MYKILICDDQPDIVNALKIYLAPEGYELYEAQNGAQAVETVKKEGIHLVLLDVMMPVMDGVTATAKIREFSNVPIILLTAKSETEDKVLGLNVGADDYITKPFVPVEVLARVRSQLRRYASLGSHQAEPDSLTIGGVTFTVQDGIYSPETGQLFASAVISADESVQLVAVEADMEHEVRLTTPVDAKLDPSGISWAEWAEQNGKTLVPIGMEAAPTLQFLKVNGQTTDTPLIGAFLTQNPDGTVSVGFQVDLSEEDVSHLKSCEVQLECRVGVFGKDGKATQWQKEILTATITFK